MFVANCLFWIGIQVGPSQPYPAPTQANKTPLLDFPLQTVVRKLHTTQKGIMALMRWGHMCMRYQNLDLYLLSTPGKAKCVVHCSHATLLMLQKESHMCFHLQKVHKQHCSLLRRLWPWPN